MAKEKIKPPVSEFGGLEAPRSKWGVTHGMYIAGRAYADEADYTAAEMEKKWGAGRLRLLVAADLRERFDRQRYLFNQAIWHGELEDVRRESGRMVKAWMALDRAAEAAGAAKLPPVVWEVPTSNGTVLAVVPDNDAAMAVQPDGRRVIVYTLEEIARIVEAHHLVNAIKTTWPGAKVEPIRRSISDPLNGVHDTALALEDEIPF